MSEWCGCAGTELIQAEPPDQTTRRVRNQNGIPTRTKYKINLTTSHRRKLQPPKNHLGRTRISISPHAPHGINHPMRYCRVKTRKVIVEINHINYFIARKFTTRHKCSN